MEPDRHGDHCPMRRGRQDLHREQRGHHGTFWPGGRDAVSETELLFQQVAYVNVLEQYDAKSGKWAEILLNSVKMTLPGLAAAGFKKGDTITVEQVPGWWKNIWPRA